VGGEVKVDIDSVVLIIPVHHGASPDFALVEHLRKRVDLDAFFYELLVQNQYWNDSVWQNLGIAFMRRLKPGEEFAICRFEDMNGNPQYSFGIGPKQRASAGEREGGAG
jgi:hypothetical protein